MWQPVEEVTICDPLLSLEHCEPVEAGEVNQLRSVLASSENNSAEVEVKISSIILIVFPVI